MKILLKIFVLALIIFPVTASAGMVRIADFGAEKFFAQIQSEISAKGVPIRITEIWRNSETDIKKISPLRMALQVRNEKYCQP